MESGTDNTQCWLPEIAALLTRMWRACSSSTMFLANSFTESSEETSNRRRWTSGFPVFSLISLTAAAPRDSLRQAKITRAPRRAKSRAMNFPIPTKGGGKHFYLTDLPQSCPKVIFFKKTQSVLDVLGGKHGGGSAPVLECAQRTSVV